MSISIVGFTLYTGISPMPSSSKVKKALSNLLPLHAVRIYELGSGWGGLTWALSSSRPNAQVYAYEISPIPWFFSRILLKFKKKSNICIKYENFFRTPLHNADIVVCYLCPSLMLNLKLKFENELKQGAWVVSNTFAIPGWIPNQIVSTNDLWKSEIYIYKKNNKTDKAT